MAKIDTDMGTILSAVAPSFPIPRAFHAAKHLVRPTDALCEAAMLAEPNLSVRMNEVTAAAIRPQLASLPERVKEYNRRYKMVRGRLRGKLCVCVRVASFLGNIKAVICAGDFFFYTC